MAKIPEHIGEIVAYHSHIYFTAESRDIAVALNEELQDLFKIWDYRWLDKSNGLHPTPMFRFAFLKEDFSRYVEWILKRRQGLNVLIHALTGDDYLDHTYLTLWLGQQLLLGIDQLDALRKKLNLDSSQSLVFSEGLDSSQAGKVRYKPGDDSYVIRGILENSYPQ